MHATSFVRQRRRRRRHHHHSRRSGAEWDQTRLQERRCALNINKCNQIENTCYIQRMELRIMY